MKKTLLQILFACILAVCSFNAQAVEGYFVFNNPTNASGTVDLGANDDFCLGSHSTKRLPGTLNPRSIGATLWKHDGGAQCGIIGLITIRMVDKGTTYTLKIDYNIPAVGKNTFKYTSDGIYGIRAVKDWANPNRSFQHSYQFEIYLRNTSEICDESVARVALSQKAAERDIKNIIGDLKETMQKRSSGNANFGDGFWWNTTGAGSALWYCCKEQKASAVWGDIYSKYQAMGNEKSRLGFPVTDEFGLKGGAGCHFQGGSIYWSRNTGSHSVWGLIKDKWAKFGWENSAMTGYPKSDEKNLPNNAGVFQEFENGNIYYKYGANEAFIVTGDIWRKWGELGWETGKLGFPTSDHAPTAKNDGALIGFEHGKIYWSEKTGSHYIMFGPIWDLFEANKWEQGRLGFPTGDPYKDGDGTISQKFQGGKIEGDRIIWY